MNIILGLGNRMSKYALIEKNVGFGGEDFAM